MSKKMALLSLVVATRLKMVLLSAVALGTMLSAMMPLTILAPCPKTLQRHAQRRTALCCRQVQRYTGAVGPPHASTEHGQTQQT